MREYEAGMRKDRYIWKERKRLGNWKISSVETFKVHVIMKAQYACKKLTNSHLYLNVRFENFALKYQR